ncbi:hypothetical protein SADUNF_Sadunf05G0115000 [Salix dunnii]|uniref:Uncharacterized protein n=1 Tax=Salix dunnii TaxID=1413687 RepID=A0A835K878_9ROSI|nr:hypothetical protein SADUNF_Sadunf05G0115000 [Salix dunnii]
MLNSVLELQKLGNLAKLWKSIIKLIAPGSLYLEAMVKLFVRIQKYYMKLRSFELPIYVSRNLPICFDMLVELSSSFAYAIIAPGSLYLEAMVKAGAIQGSCIGPHGAQPRLPLWCDHEQIKNAEGCIVEIIGENNLLLCWYSGY